MIENTFHCVYSLHTLLGSSQQLTKMDNPKFFELGRVARAGIDTSIKAKNAAHIQKAWSLVTCTDGKSIGSYASIGNLKVFLTIYYSIMSRYK